jgi:hypothetical protein
MIPRYHQPQGQLAGPARPKPFDRRRRAARSRTCILKLMGVFMKSIFGGPQAMMRS